MLTSGISAMRHAEKHINLDEISDEMEEVHPIFIHNYVLCLISVFAMIFFLISFYLLNDIRIYKVRKLIFHFYLCYFLLVKYIEFYVPVMMT